MYQKLSYITWLNNCGVCSKCHWLSVTANLFYNANKVGRFGCDLSIQYQPALSSLDLGEVNHVPAQMLRSGKTLFNTF
jgi:hypothetical protein